MINVDKPIYELHIPTRVRMALSNILVRKRKPATFGEALNIRKSELLREPNFGKRSLREWKEFVVRNAPHRAPKAVAKTQVELPLDKPTTQEVPVQTIVSVERQREPRAVAKQAGDTTARANRLLEIARLNNRIGAAYAVIAKTQTELAQLYLGDKK